MIPDMLRDLTIMLGQTFHSFGIPESLTSDEQPPVHSRGDKSLPEKAGNTSQKILSGIYPCQPKSRKV